MLTKKNDSATLGNEDISTPNSRVLTKKKHQLQTILMTLIFIVMLVRD